MVPNGVPDSWFSPASEALLKFESLNFAASKSPKLLSRDHNLTSYVAMV